MNFRKYLLLCIVSFAILASGCQRPQYSRTGVEIPPVFDEWDLNKNGRVTQGEVVRYRTVRFDKFDKDKNEIWNRQEFDLYCQKSRRANPDCRKPDSHFIELDWNKDGMISRKEFIEYDPPLFIALDLNGDGVITQKEIRPKGDQGFQGGGGSRNDRRSRP